jgi:hypothetical protein
MDAFELVRKSALLVALMFALTHSSVCLGQVEVVEPTSSFTARVIGTNVLVGAPSGTEGTQWQSNFLDIKEGTSDRVVLEYDLRGKATASSAVLNLELTNLDVPSFTPIHMYWFAGNGLANAADYYRTDHFITTFTDNGLASNFIPPYHIPYSFDLTAHYNQAVAAGNDFFGIVMKNVTSGSLYARYRLTTFGGLPKLTVMTVPEPTLGGLSLLAGVIGFVGHLGHRRR